MHIAQNFNLIGALIIAGDSTKLRAQNSKKNNYNEKKIKRHLDYIENKLNEYNQALAEADGDTQDLEDIHSNIQKHQKQQKKYEQIQQELDNSSDKQVSTIDPDARHQIVRNNITEVYYTLQTTIDDKYKIPIDYLLTNQNDKKAMGTMLRRAKSILRTNQFTALYDKGYHTGSEFKTAHDLGISTLVAIPAISRAAQAPDPDYNVEHFDYHHIDDQYTCPQNQQLISNGSWYSRRNYRFKQYKTKACKTCPVKEQCTTAKNGKIVQRSEYTAYIEENAKRIAQSQNLYKKRQAIVEHPFGTLKRPWGYDHILTKKSKARASSDVGFMMIAYNLKRIINIIGIQAMMGALKQLLTTPITRILNLLRSIRLQIKSFLSLL